MIRNVSLEDISDGRFYTENDCVRTDTNNCAGCRTVCCQNMGNTIKLDPKDCFDIELATGCTFDALLGSGKVELNVVDGLIIPNLKMNEENGRCAFLDESNRCIIHSSRPGICRMFPLGRYWESKDKFHYILQKGECNKDNLSKIKVKKWLGIEGLEEYNRYVVAWHELVKELEEALSSLSEEQIRILNTFVLRMFYLAPFSGCSTTAQFYAEFDKRVNDARVKLGM